MAASTYSTCQRCGRGILVKDGVLALHALEKVQPGKIATKCPGSGREPIRPPYTVRS